MAFKIHVVPSSLPGVGVQVLPRQHLPHDPNPEVLVPLLVAQQTHTPPKGKVVFPPQSQMLLNYSAHEALDLDAEIKI